MSSTRQISWTTALRDIRNDRLQVVPPATAAERIARQQDRAEAVRIYRVANQALTAAWSRPLATAAGYDRSAIMGLANAMVREQIAARRPGTYRTLFGAALKAAWAAAHDARRAAAH